MKIVDVVDDIIQAMNKGGKRGLFLILWAVNLQEREKSCGKILLNYMLRRWRCFLQY